MNIASAELSVACGLSALQSLVLQLMGQLVSHLCCCRRLEAWRLPTDPRVWRWRQGEAVRQLLLPRLARELATHEALHLTRNLLTLKILIVVT